MSKRFKMVCPECGSDDIRADACSWWNIETQQWEAESSYDADGAECNDCCEEFRYAESQEIV